MHFAGWQSWKMWVFKVVKNCIYAFVQKKKIWKLYKIQFKNNLFKQGIDLKKRSGGRNVGYSYVKKNCVLTIIL